MASSSHNKLRLLACVLLVGAFAFLAWRAWGPKPAEVEHPPMRMIVVGEGSPEIRVPAYKFRREMALPFRVPRNPCELSFIPYSPERAISEEGAIEVSVLADDKRTLLGQVAPRAFPGASLGFINQESRFDLSAFSGQEIEVRWSRTGGNPDTHATIAVVKIVATPPTPTPPASDSRPHILMICSDTHRFDFSIGEPGAAMMPELGKLRAEATTYQRAFSQASWTQPSIASVFTGRLPRMHGSGLRTERGDYSIEMDRRRGEGAFFYRIGVEQFAVLRTHASQLPTLPEILRGEGYTTALVAGNLLYGMLGLASDGFDVVVDTRVAPGDELNAAAKQILAAAPGDRPLFLVVHYMDVHEWGDWYVRREDKSADEYALSREQARDYYAMAVRDTDRYLGELIRAWDAWRGAGEDMIVFFADHGDHLRDEGRPELQSMNRSNHSWEQLLAMPILNHGNSMDDVLLHVPLVVKYPGATPASGVTVSSEVGLLDIFPTVLRAAKVSLPEATFEGVPLPHDGATTEGMRLLPADFQLYGDELSSLRRGNMKAVFNLDNGEDALVDTSATPAAPGGEPGQRIEDAESLNSLRAAFDEYRKRAEASAVIADFKVDADQATKDMRELGYIK